MRERNKIKLLLRSVGLLLNYLVMLINEPNCKNAHTTKVGVDTDGHSITIDRRKSYSSTTRIDIVKNQKRTFIFRRPNTKSLFNQNLIILTKL